MATEELIDKVYLFPALYHVEHRDYKNIKKKEKIWEQIAQSLGESSELVKKKWKNLRDSYTKHLTANKCTSTTGEKKPYEAWKWSAKMEWFKPFVTNAKVQGNVEFEDNVGPPLQILIDEITSLDKVDQPDATEYYEEEESEEDCQRRESLCTDKEKPRGKKRKVVTVTETDKVIKYLDSKQKEMDETDYLMIGVAKSIRKLSRKRQIIAKKRINDVVAELELEDLEDLNSTLTVVSPSTSFSLFKPQ